MKTCVRPGCGSNVDTRYFDDYCGHKCKDLHAVEIERDNLMLENKELRRIISVVFQYTPVLTEDLECPVCGHGFFGHEPKCELSKALDIADEYVRDSTGDG